METVMPEDIRAYLIGIVAFLIALWLIARARRASIVRKTSRVLPEIARINSSYQFTPINRTQSLHRALNSKAQFDRFDAKEFVLTIIGEQLSAYQLWFDGAMRNEGLWKEYLEEIAALGTTGYENRRLAKTEERLIKWKLLPAPVVSIEIVVEWGYTSPKGRNSYRGRMRFGGDETKALFARAEARKRSQSSRQACIKRERALMTDSLRYDVLRRDGFRCVLCGSAGSDGVKLEVDHIVPVARGGRTELSNLRTLCDRCNRGKRDKIESRLS